MLNEQANVLRFLLSYGESLAADISAADFCKQPLAGMNHPAWIFGHLAFATDRHSTFVGGEQHLAEWADRFGKGSQLSTELSDYPAKEQLLAEWRGAGERLITAVEASPPEVLSAANTHIRPEAFPTLADFLTFTMTAHTSVHLGQLSAWRRAMGRDPMF
ncbi:MAG: DinB family protein [Planctomycetota bacterium]